MANATRQDVILVPDAPRDADIKSLQNHLQRLSLTVRFNATLSRQHRGLLLAIKALTVPPEVLALGTTASGTYVQSELQAVIDKIDAIAANQRLILDLLGALVALPDAQMEPLKNVK